jgi:outer membrane lipoprotein
MTKTALSFFLIFLAPAVVTSVHAQEYGPPSSASGVSQPTVGELQIHPEVYRGQEIILGGQVISIRQDRETTQLEIMQLPLAEKNAPEANPALTQGRFLAFQKSGLSPAAIAPGALVTVVGTMVGSAVADPNETSVLYPVLEVKTLTVWSQPAAAEAAPTLGQPGYPIQPPYPTQPPPLPDPSPMGSNFYYTPYWDSGLAVWYWRPFWVYPWWAHAVFVPPSRVAIIRPHAVPFGRPPHLGARPHGRLPNYIVPPIGHSRVLPAPGPRIGRPPSRSAPYIVPPIGQPHSGGQRQSRAGRSPGHQQGRGPR